jgi:hypothetical protein
VTAPILYCHCAHAQVIPDATKQAVLADLAASGRPFEAVADLCEMSARRDPALAQLLTRPDLRIVACHRRAVAWLMHAAGTALPADAVVHNMRTDPPAALLAAIDAPPPPVNTEEPAPATQSATASQP